MLTLPPYAGRERIIHTHENAYCTILSWDEKFSGFQIAKTSVNKRLLCYRFLTLSVPAVLFYVCAALWSELHSPLLLPFEAKSQLASPRSGDYLGASLGVRSVALLHLFNVSE